MRTARALALAALGLGLLAAPRSPANAEPLNSGLLCGFVSGTDPSSEVGTQTGVIGGGPVTIADDTDPTVTHTGHLVCTLQVGSANMTHGGANAAVVSGPDTPDVAVLPETTISYSAGATDDVYMCSELVVDGYHYYYDETLPNQDPTLNGEWSNNPATAQCGLSISASTEDEGTSVYGRPFAGGPKPPPSSAPYYPPATVQIDGSPAGTSVNEPGLGWDCTPLPPTATSVGAQCTPPAAPAGSYNVCGFVSTDVTNTGLGTVSGDSGCAGGAHASASSTGPASPGHGSAVPLANFAWTCKANFNQPVPTLWKVICTVND